MVLVGQYLQMTPTHKPENILLKEQFGWEVVLSDFGLVRVFNQDGKKPVGRTGKGRSTVLPGRGASGSGEYSPSVVDSHHAPGAAAGSGAAASACEGAASMDDDGQSGDEGAESGESSGSESEDDVPPPPPPPGYSDSEDDDEKEEEEEDDEGAAATPKSFLASHTGMVGFEPMTLCGSSYYIAPEILRKGGPEGTAYTSAVDLWSAGVVLYIMLVGSPPFERPPTDPAWAVSFPDAWGWDAVSPAAKGLVAQLLTLDPAGRATAEQAGEHPWLAPAVQAAALAAAAAALMQGGYSSAAVGRPAAATAEPSPTGVGSPGAPDGSGSTASGSPPQLLPPPPQLAPLFAPGGAMYGMQAGFGGGGMPAGMYGIGGLGDSPGSPGYNSALRKMLASSSAEPSPDTASPQLSPTSTDFAAAHAATQAAAAVGAMSAPPPQPPCSSVAAVRAGALSPYYATSIKKFNVKRKLSNAATPTLASRKDLSSPAMSRLKVRVKERTTVPPLFFRLLLLFYVSSPCSVIRRRDS